MTELYPTEGCVPGGRLDALPDGARTAVCLDDALEDFVIVEGPEAVERLALPLLLACDLIELFDADPGRSTGDSLIRDSICPGRM